MNNVIATIKPWNIDMFQEVSKSFSFTGSWYLITEKNELTYQYLWALSPRYVFFPHWSWLLPPKIYNNFECVGFHCSDLPNGRGGSPLQHQIIKGKEHTKITAFRIGEGVDTGAIYLQRDLCLTGSAEEVYIRAAELIFKVMIPYIFTSEIPPTNQIGAGTYNKRRTPEMSQIPDNMKNLKQLYNFIRALDAETYPHAFSQIGKLKVHFTQAQLKTNRLLANVEVTCE